MNNNTILKKITIAHTFKHFEIKEIFKAGGADFSSSQVKTFMAGSQNKNYIKLTDEQLESFLNGLIVYSRGATDEPEMLPKMVENYIISQIEAGNSGMLGEVRCLIEDAADAADATETTENES
ncbi:MAG: DUF1456 family protein [Mariprofundaceae bacterium]|nr:DUF1456 family protein [Mariprofundaceae bacterium]